MSKIKDKLSLHMFNGGDYLTMWGMQGIQIFWKVVFFVCVFEFTLLKVVKCVFLFGFIPVTLCLLSLGSSLTICKTSTSECGPSYTGLWEGLWRTKEDVWKVYNLIICDLSPHPAGTKLATWPCWSPRCKRMLTRWRKTSSTLRNCWLWWEHSNKDKPMHYWCTTISGKLFLKEITLTVVCFY